MRCASPCHARSPRRHAPPSDSSPPATAPPAYREFVTPQARQAPHDDPRRRNTHVAAFSPLTASRNTSTADMATGRQARRTNGSAFELGTWRLRWSIEPPPPANTAPSANPRAPPPPAALPPRSAHRPARRPAPTQPTNRTRLTNACGVPPQTPNAPPPPAGAAHRSIAPRPPYAVPPSARPKCKACQPLSYGNSLRSLAAALHHPKAHNQAGAAPGSLAPRPALPPADAPTFTVHPRKSAYTSSSVFPNNPATPRRAIARPTPQAGSPSPGTPHTAYGRWAKIPYPTSYCRARHTQSTRAPGACRPNQMPAHPRSQHTACAAASSSRGNSPGCGRPPSSDRPESFFTAHLR